MLFGVAACVQDDFESHGMTVLFLNCNAMCRGSPALRERIYPLVLDVEPTISAEMNIAKNLFMLLDCFRGDAPYSYDVAQINSKVLSEIDTCVQETHLTPLPKAVLFLVEFAKKHAGKYDKSIFQDAGA